MIEVTVIFVSTRFVEVILTVVKVPPINKLFEIKAFAELIVVPESKPVETVLKVPKLEFNIPEVILANEPADTNNEGIVAPTDVTNEDELIVFTFKVPFVLYIFPEM